MLVCTSVFRSSFLILGGLTNKSHWIFTEAAGVRWVKNFSFGLAEFRLRKDKKREDFKRIGLLEHLCLAVELLSWYICHLSVFTLLEQHWWNVFLIVCKRYNSVASNKFIKDMGMKRRVEFNSSDLTANRKMGRNEGAWESKSISRKTLALHIVIDPSWQQREKESKKGVSAGQ